jgi:hypothetical protein
MKQAATLMLPAPFCPPVGDPIVTPLDPTSLISLAVKGEVVAPIGTAPAVNVVRCEGPPTSIVPVPVSGEGDTTMLVSPAVMLTEPPPPGQLPVLMLPLESRTSPLAQVPLAKPDISGVPRTVRFCTVGEG